MSPPEPEGGARTLRKLVVICGVILVASGLVACGDDGDDSGGSGAPDLTAEQRDDPALVSGETIYGDQCARCHGAGGQGLNGPSLRGVDETYPDIADQIAVIEDGRPGMPAFAGRLSAEEIEAVARYEREVL